MTDALWTDQYDTVATDYIAGRIDRLTFRKRMAALGFKSWEINDHETALDGGEYLTNIAPDGGAISWARFAFEEFITILVLLAFSGTVLAFASLIAHGGIK